ncbi:SpaH/EbpB family LPXTG-anchored major pilin [Canibacter sp. lx-72]|uniref:SpaH/EbpB family LPXTG-anchored major pilin n=1 Tax=Canibacter zhuwentaonis TaxID=2837491 RepID=UPI001BDBB22F|nr:SpaH/EbpB family LPXTG-anchored major pilin [Canibacter zhuwentaonis]MBT1018736.1 SpaH/EbpB family LPXTG-anchored major pilin [Canibacter zhuwentaonis]
MELSQVSGVYLEVVLTGVVFLLLKARGVVSNILTLALVFSTLASAQTGQTVAGVGVATGQNTLLQVAGDKPVKPTTTTTSLQPNNTGANNTSKTKPATNPPHTTQLPAGINRTTFLEGLIKTRTEINGQTQYHPGETISISVYTDYDETKYDLLDAITLNGETHYTVTVNVAVTLPQGFEISPQVLTRGPFTQDCTTNFTCPFGYSFSYNPQSRVIQASYKVYHDKFVGGGQLFEIITIPGTATNHIGSHTVRTTADGVIEFPIGKLGGVAERANFTAVESDATFRVVPRKTTLTAAFTPVGLTEGQVVVSGNVVCTFPGSQPSRKTLMFTLKHNELAGGKWNRELNNMVDAGSTCVITINKGAVPAGWKWKIPDRITQTERNITTPRTSTIRLDKDCTNRRQCTQDGFEWRYNQQSHRLTGSFPIPNKHYKDGGEYQLFEELNITGTVTGTPNTSHTVTTTADGRLDFIYIDFKTNSRVNDVQEYFTAIPSQAVFQIIPRKTTLTASFTPVGLTEGQVVVTGQVLCINPQGQSDRRNIMFTLKHNQLVGGKWNRELNNMVDAGSTCVITIVKGAVPAGWRWKTPDRITQTEQNITSSRTSTIRLEVEKIPIEVSTETTIVHKHKQQTPQGNPGTGQPENPAPAGDAIAGVVFKIQKLNLNLTQNTDWMMLKTLTVDDAKNRVVAGFETIKTTNLNGEATFDNLDIGAYLVTETNAPDNVVKKAAPFIVTVPHPNGNNTWNYNVHVYPKNTVSAKPTKTLDDTNAIKIGDSVTWTITQVLPELQQGETFTEVSFTDQLAEKLDYVNTTAQVDGMEVNVTVTATGDGNRTLTGHLDDTTTLRGGQTVTFKITTKVNKPGKIVNTANVRIKTSNGGDTTQQTPDPGQSPGGAPTLIYGYFDIQKYVKDTMIAISDATFEFYKSTDCTGNKVDFGETLVTVDTGRLVGAIAVKAGTYSIKEIKAPTGYVLNTMCFPVTVGENNTLTKPATVTVYNSKVTVPALPLTGAQGQTIMLTTGGILITAGIAAVAIVHRKRKLTANKNTIQH